MVRTKVPGPDLPQHEEPSSRKRGGEASEDLREKRKKARLEARMTWIGERGVTCERNLDLMSLTPRNEAVQAIQNHGMHFWFEAVDGYNLSMCREFYQTLGLADEGGVEMLKAKVRGKVITVTPDVIASLLGEYQRPPNDSPTYPDNVTKAKTINELVELMYVDPSMFKGNVQSGKLKHSYGLLNKLLHCNMLPRGSEKKPNLEKLALLDAVMSGVTIDFALFIWGQMKDFANTQRPQTNLPFGSLVTRLCKLSKVKPYVFDQLTPPEFGAIGRTSKKKRKALSRGRRATPVGTGSDAPGASSSAGPSAAAPERSVSQRLDDIEATMRGMAEMMREMYVHTFPDRPIPGVPPPAAPAPPVPTDVEMGGDDTEEGDGNESGSEYDVGGDSDEGEGDDE